MFIAYFQTQNKQGQLVIIILDEKPSVSYSTHARNDIAYTRRRHTNVMRSIIIIINYILTFEILHIYST